MLLCKSYELLHDKNYNTTSQEKGSLLSKLLKTVFDVQKFQLYRATLQGCNLRVCSLERSKAKALPSYQRQLNLLKSLMKIIIHTRKY